MSDGTIEEDFEEALAKEMEANNASLRSPGWLRTFFSYPVLYWRRAAPVLLDGPALRVVSEEKLRLNIFFTSLKNLR